MKEKAMATTYAARLTELETDYGKAFDSKQANLAGLAEAVRAKNVAQIESERGKIREVQKTEAQIDAG